MAQFAEDGAVVIGGGGIDDVEDAMFRDDESMAECLTFRRFVSVLWVEQLRVLAPVVGGMVGDNDAVFCFR